MASESEGSIRVKATMEHTGFDKGIEDMKKGLESLSTAVKKFAKSMGISLTPQAFVKYGKEAITNAEAMEKTWEALSKAITRHGRSFTEAQGFIQDYVADGLVPLEDAMEAYGDLAERGYDDSQIRQMMTALKETAAIGREAGSGLGETVAGATENLKKGSFALADSAGNVKTAAQMWEDYAASLGIAVEELSREQMIQAELNGVLAETASQVGDAATVAGSYAGQVSQLSYNFQSLSTAIGQGLIPLAEAVLPGINAILSGLVSLANVFARVSALLFGKSLSAQATAQMEISSTGSAAADATDALAKSTGKAGKAAQKAGEDFKSVLAGFDQLNILAFDAAKNVGGVGGSLGGISAGNIKLPEAETGELFGGLEISPKLEAALEKLKAALDRLWESLKPLGKTVGEGLQWLWENALKPLGEWAVADAVPAFLDMLGASAGVLNEALIALKPAALWLWDGLLEPLAQWTGGAIVDVLREITDLLNDLTQVLSGEISFENFVSSLTPVQTALLSLAGAFGAAALAGKIGAVSTAIEKFVKGIKNANSESVLGKLAETIYYIKSTIPLGEAIEGAFGKGSSSIAGVGAAVGGAVFAVTNFISMLENGFSWINEALMVLGIAIAAVGAVILGVSAPVAVVVAAVAAGVATLVIIIKEHWEKIKEILSAVWEGIKEIWSPVAAWFSENVIAPVAEYFSAVGQTINDIFEGCWIIIQAIWKFAAQQVKANILDPIVNKITLFVEFILCLFLVLRSEAERIWGEFVNWFNEHLAEPIKTIVQGICDFMKFLFNGLIGLLEGMLNNAINGINRFLIGFSAAVARAARFIGADWKGVSLLPTVSLPRLANGAVIPPNQQFAAILGDQRSGVNIEAPLTTIEQALQNVMDRNGGTGKEIHITVESILDGKVVARNTVRHINDMTRSAGKPVLVL